MREGQLKRPAIPILLGVPAALAVVAIAWLGLAPPTAAELRRLHLEAMSLPDDVALTVSFVNCERIRVAEFSCIYSAVDASGDVLPSPFIGGEHARVRRVRGRLEFAPVGGIRRDAR